jgi:hypothetical protein
MKGDRQDEMMKTCREVTSYSEGPLNLSFENDVPVMLQDHLCTDVTIPHEKD